VELRAAGASVVAEHGRLLVAERGPEHAAWARNVWLDPREIPIASIADAARKLRAVQRNWALQAHAHFRRAALIEKALPHVSRRPLRFPAPLPKSPLGSWTLLRPDLLLASPRCSSPFANGEVRFVEDRKGPPNRAYLKLWEALTLVQRWPRPGERCIDLGGSPGGWTYALAKLGARVTSVDKAPLHPRVAAMPGVTFRRESAFGLDPRREPPYDWLFCDVACYPARLLGLAERWLDRARNLLCTIKFQGATDHEAANAFRQIPGSRLLHLFHNKHELTWIRLAPPSAEPPPIL